MSLIHLRELTGTDDTERLRSFAGAVARFADRIAVGALSPHHAASRSSRPLIPPPRWRHSAVRPTSGAFSPGHFSRTYLRRGAHIDHRDYTRRLPGTGRRLRRHLSAALPGHPARRPGRVRPHAGKPVHRQKRRAATRRNGPSVKLSGQEPMQISLQLERRRRVRRRPNSASSPAPVWPYATRGHLHHHNH